MRETKFYTITKQVQLAVCVLTFLSLPVITLLTTRFNVKKFCMLVTLHLCVLYGSQNKQYLLSYTSLTDWFYNRSGECLQRGTDRVII